MTLSAAGRRIERPQGVSERGRLVIGLVVGGREWLEWAIRDPGARYQFEDENALVAGVQTTLHDSRLVLLPRLGLWVSPIKLMTLRPAELRTLARAEECQSAGTAASVKRIFADHRLVPGAGLAAGGDFLKELAVHDAPHFQCMSSGEQLAIVELVRDPAEGEPRETGLRKEAAAFALEHSRTPLEFADYYRAYLKLAAAEKAPRSLPQRKEHAEAALAALVPILFQALDCPRVDGTPAPWKVLAATEEWLMTGRRLGFSRLSRGVQQVIAHAGFTGNEDEEAERIVGAYLMGAQALLMSADLDAGRISQDGTRTFRASSKTHEAEVAAPPSGIIALNAFRPLPEEPHAPPSPDRALTA